MFNKQQDEQTSISTADLAASKRVAAAVRKARLTAPATLLLALGKPLGYFAAQMLYLGSPFLRLLDGASGGRFAPRAATLAHLLENPATLEHLTAQLEQAEQRPADESR